MESALKEAGEINKILKQGFWKNKWAENESLGRQHLVVPVSQCKGLKHSYTEVAVYSEGFLPMPVTSWSCVEVARITGGLPLVSKVWWQQDYPPWEIHTLECQTATDGCTFQDQQRKDIIAPVPGPITERHAPSPQRVETHSPSRGDIVFHRERSLGHSPHWRNLLKL